MQHQRIDPIAEGDAVQPIPAHHAENAPHLVLIMGDVGGEGCAATAAVRRGRAGAATRVEHLDERRGAGRLDTDRFDDGHAQFAAQLIGVDEDALAAGDIRHVERDHHGQPQALQAQDQP